MRDQNGILIQLEVGMILYGFCGGAFGRDSYENKRVEAVGTDWVVVRYVESGKVGFLGIYEGEWPQGLNELMEYTRKGDGDISWGSDG